MSTLTKIVLSIALILGSIMAFSFTGITPPERKVITPPNLLQAQIQLNKYINQGWQIETICSESVGTSVNSKTTAFTIYPDTYRDIHGGFVIVLIKKY